MHAQRFLDAQATTWRAARAEIAAGRKEGHWMWFVFPQMRGLGRSPTAERYALDGIEDAAAYLRHPVLGPRLIEAMHLMLINSGFGAERVLGSVDALKLCSCATLFARVPGAPDVFEAVLAAFYERPCERTERMLGAPGWTPPRPDDGLATA